MQIVRARLPHEPKHLPNGEPEIIGQASIGALVRFPILEDRGEGYVQRYFEKYVRSPGCRIIAVQDGKIYVQKEFRFEQDRFDWRLPGGKVIDAFEEYKQFLGKSIPDEIVIDACKRELREEAGLEAGEWSVFQKQICGTTVEWDLYYVVARGISQVHKQEHEGEHMQDAGWFAFDEVRRMCETGEMEEGRSVAALIQFMAAQQ